MEADMWRSKLMSACVAVVAACGAVTPGSGEPQTATITAEAVSGPPCPDPTTDCTQSNGTGVFTQEGGYAGIGSSQFMVTRFINVQLPEGQAVAFHGRYRNLSTGDWEFLAQPGFIASAIYASQPHLRVLSVTENATVPTWTLLEDGSTDPIYVTGTDLLDLRLELFFPANGTNSAASAGASVGIGHDLRTLWLGFDAATTAHDKRTVHAYNVRWWADTMTGSPPVQYCVDAHQVADPVVFQQGIQVDPVTGAVTRDASSVTMSCSLGAPAMVYRWGYDHRSSSTFYFDAGIHMKRASYCANKHYYTAAGTQIEIRDDKGINNTAIQHLEARWTPTGASCVNLENLRHASMGFRGWCAGTRLPACSTVTPRGPAGASLADGPVTPGP
jgi:hypothetical protein